MKKILLEFRNMENSILNLMKSGIRISFYISIFASILLLAYNFFFASPTIYYIGISLFKTSLFFIVGFIIYAFAFSRIKKELGI